MRKTIQSLLATIPFLLAVGCVDAAKAPAESAIKAGEGAIASITAEVQKLAPEQSKAAADALASAKAAAAKEDWKSALAAAKDLPEMVKAAVAAAKAQAEAMEKAAAAKLAEAKAAWAAAEKDLTAKIADLKKEVAKLSKSKKLPKGVTKAGVTKCKASVAELEVALTKAGEQAKTDVVAATASAKDLQVKAAEAAALLGKK